MSEIKEEFCGVCVAGLTALAGVGTAGASTKVDKKKKKVMFWVGISITIISILFILYMLNRKEGCSSCSSA